MIQAIDWAIDHKNQYHIGVINLSLGAPVLQPFWTIRCARRWSVRRTRGYCGGGGGE